MIFHNKTKLVWCLKAPIQNTTPNTLKLNHLQTLAHGIWNCLSYLGIDFVLIFWTIFFANPSFSNESWRQVLEHLLTLTQPMRTYTSGGSYFKKNINGEKIRTHRIQISYMYIYLFIYISIVHVYIFVASRPIQIIFFIIIFLLRRKILRKMASQSFPQ